ncbi:MAG: lactate utilization protein [Deltaproteobacteria bacterium]|nr:lactate utilization protein [Deltaproteobacteria bacterium]
MEPVSRKEELLRRIAIALRGLEGAKPPPAAGLGRDGPRNESERIALFREMLESQGGAFLAGPSFEQMVAALGEALRLSAVTALFHPDGDPGARLVAETLVPFGPFTLISPEEVRRSSAPSSAGIQTAEFAIAETGTIAQTGRGGKSLIPGLLPDVHVALLSRSALVDRMEECLAALSGDLPRNVSFITGPSRTADIEQTLTVGAHGPKKTIAVLLP